MMSRIYLILAVLAVIFHQQTNAWVSMHLNAKHPDKDACLTGLGTVIKVGETVQEPGQCAKAKCSHGYTINYVGCGSVHTSDADCFPTKTDARHPYPLCCPNYYCKGKGYVFYKKEQETYTLPDPYEANIIDH